MRKPRVKRDGWGGPELECQSVKPWDWAPRVWIAGCSMRPRQLRSISDWCLKAADWLEEREK